jgi:hypothetical protein
MSPLLYVAAVLSLSAIAVTIYAFISAPEGYEDKQGFHAFRRRRKSEGLVTPPAKKEPEALARSSPAE